MYIGTHDLRNFIRLQYVGRLVYVGDAESVMKPVMRSLHNIAPPEIETNLPSWHTGEPRGRAL
jgi:hypothetical protein